METLNWASLFVLIHQQTQRNTGAHSGGSALSVRTTASACELTAILNLLMRGLLPVLWSQSWHPNKTWTLLPPFLTCRGVLHVDAWGYCLCTNATAVPPPACRLATVDNVQPQLCLSPANFTIRQLGRRAQQSCVSRRNRHKAEQK